MRNKIDIAIKHFWHRRNQQRADHLVKHGSLLGSGSAVAANTHLDALTKVIANSVNLYGHNDIEKYLDYPIPGWYRPLKNWDIVIKQGDEISAAIELKSMAGESFGKNINHRTEEAVGTAQDLIMAHKMGLINKRPWLGYVYVMDSNDISEKQLKVSNENMDDAFIGASYVDRIKIMGERLVSSQVYDAVWFIKTSDDLSWSEPSEILGYKNFFDLLRWHVSAII